jgi:molecular chaperone GrpE
MPAIQREGDRSFRGMNETKVEKNNETASETETEVKELQEPTKDDLLEEIQELRKTSEKNYDLYLRSQAEIENIKKRNKKEKEDWLKYANESLIKDLLPSLDSLEKALAHTNNQNTLDALRDGVGLTLKAIKGVLSRSGLEEVRAKGETFDPSFHEAVSQIENNDVKPGTIVEELQKGYLLNKRLIRPAMVVVSKSASAGSANHSEAPAKAREKKH